MLTYIISKVKPALKCLWLQVWLRNNILSTSSYFAVHLSLSEPSGFSTSPLTMNLPQARIPPKLLASKAFINEQTPRWANPQVCETHGPSTCRQAHYLRMWPKAFPRVQGDPAQDAQLAGGQMKSSWFLSENLTQYPPQICQLFLTLSNQLPFLWL